MTQELSSSRRKPGATTPAAGGANISGSQASETLVEGGSLRAVPSAEGLAVVERPAQDKKPVSAGSDEKPWTMACYNGPRLEGHNYTFTLREVIPSLIADKPKSAAQVAELAGRHTATAKGILVEMHAAGQCHIARWQRAVRGPFIACYLLGPGEDAPKPRLLTAAEKCKRYRRTIRGQGVTITNRIKRKAKTGGLRAVDPLLAAIMGVTGKMTEAA